MGVVDSTKNKEALQGHEKIAKLDEQGHSILSYVRSFEQKFCSSQTTLLHKTLLYSIQPDTIWSIFYD